jgi:hypothetical protein
MVQIDIPAAFVASMLFLDVGRKTVAREAKADQAARPAVFYRFLFRSVFFAGAVIAPAGIYLLAGWPGWEQLYWTERVEKVIYSWPNAALPALFVMAIVLAAYGGHILGYRWLVTGKGKLLRPTYIGVLAAVGIVVLATYPAFTVVGTYAEYHGNRETMESALSNPYGFGVGWVIVMVYFSAALLWTVLRIRRESRGG